MRSGGSIDLNEGRRIAEELQRSGKLRPANAPLPIERDGKFIVAEGGAVAHWVDITPEMAARWLKNNFGNRPVSEDVVKAYARDMMQKRWKPTHQGIAFNDKSELIDGQHRLLAIVMAKVTVRMMVTFGLSSRAEGEEMTTMDCVDRGRTRSVADQLKIQHKISNGTIVSSLCAALGSLCFGERTRRLSVGQTLDIYRLFEPAVDYVIEHKSKEHGLRTAGVIAGFAFALASDDEKFWEKDTRLTKMFAAVNTGEGLKEGQPMLKLREFLRSDEAKLFTRSLDRGLAELVLGAIRAELKGEPCKELAADLRGVEFFKELQPERVAKVAAMFALPKSPEIHHGDTETQSRKPKKPKTEIPAEERNAKIFDSLPAVKAAPKAAAKVSAPTVAPAIPPLTKEQRKLFDSLDDKFTVPDVNALFDGDGAKASDFLTAILRNKMIRSRGYQCYVKA